MWRNSAESGIALILPIRLFLTSHVLPSVKGSSLFLMSFGLNVISIDTRNMILWCLTVIVTCYAIYDFHLKIQYKHRNERMRKKREAEEASPRPSPKERED